MTYKRLSAEERKTQIKEAAKRIFLKKQFSNTTMEDIIKESGMSKGGVYNYYKSRIDILRDLVLDSNKYRLKVSVATSKQYPTLSEKELFVELLIDKFIDYNEYKSLYSMLLVEKKNSQDFDKFYDNLIEESSQVFFKALGDKELRSQLNIDVRYFKLFSSRDFVEFYNTFIVGMEVLSNRERFLENRSFLRGLFTAYIDVNIDATASEGKFNE